LKHREQREVRGTRISIPAPSEAPRLYSYRLHTTTSVVLMEAYDRTVGGSQVLRPEQFKLVGLLGRGSYGSVFKAQEIDSGEYVAIKVRRLGSM